ncbi:MAG: DUF1684 domain-containing protein [Balneolales bacterium]
MALLVRVFLSGIFVVSSLNAFDDDDDYRASVEEWHSDRVEALKADQGWLRTAGIYWLREGEQSFGSSENVRIQFPEGSIPEFAGILNLEADTVKIQVSGNIDIRNQHGHRIQEGIIFTPEEAEEKMVLHYRSLTWFVVQREDGIGIRLFDDNSPYLTHFEGIERYDIDPDWRVEAEFIPHNDGTTILIENIIGQLVEWVSAGTLTFSVDGEDVNLIALGSGDRLFVPFADATAGSETYASGRFLYIDRPEPGQPATIDFNVSYNPPCAFSPHTTCPIPPEQNRVEFPIRAGEKNYEMYSVEN